jgi:NitT/TauT family transport system substrate-binding protein
MRRAWTTTRALAVLCLALAITGCNEQATTDGAGGDGGDGGGKITLGFSAWPGWFPWQVAADQGLFAKNGVEVEMKYFENYTDSLNALSTGNIDANSQTLNDTISSVAGGAKQTIVLVNDNSTGNDQIIAREGIANVSDLKGKTVAAEEGTVDHYLLLLALEKAGLGPSDIKFTPLATDAAAAAFVAGRVDAVGVFAPFTTTALGRKGSKAIATSADFPGAIPDHLVVSPSLVKDRPDDVQAMVKTWFDTVDWIRANRDKAIAIMAERAGVSADDYATYDAGTSIFSLEQNLEAFAPGSTDAHLDFQARKITDFLLQTELIDTKPDLEGLLADQFVKAMQ